jgi:hypothetical protein
MAVTLAWYKAWPRVTGISQIQVVCVPDLPVKVPMFGPQLDVT